MKNTTKTAKGIGYAWIGGDGGAYMLVREPGQRKVSEQRFADECAASEAAQDAARTAKVKYIGEDRF